MLNSTHSAIPSFSAQPEVADLTWAVSFSRWPLGVLLNVLSSVRNAPVHTRDPDRGHLAEKAGLR